MSAPLSNVKLTPPLVTLILINWNYVSFVGAAIDSILAQDYPSLEIIIVDNGSTDGSLAEIMSRAAADQRVRIIRNDENLGQLGALFQVFDEIRGDFVAIVDADDVLMNNFVSCHVQAHIALPQPVAFTSSNVVEINAEGQVLTGGYGVFGKGQDSRARWLPDPNAVPRLETISDRDYRQLARSTSAIPNTEFGWFWAPGTANIYRRSILNVIRQRRDGKAYIRAADTYLNPLSHALAGSALIGERLSFYRVHDRNYYAVHESMNTMNFGKSEVEVRGELLKCETIEFLFRNVDYFIGLVGRERFWVLIDQASMEPLSRGVFRNPYLVKAVAENFSGLAPAFGTKRLCTELSVRMRPRLLHAALRGAHGGRIPLGLRRIILRISLSRRVSKWRGKRQKGEYVLPQMAALHHGSDDQRSDFGPVAALSRDPPVFMSGIAFDEFLGIALAFGRRYGDIPAGFIIYPTWSIEDRARSAQVAAAAAAHRHRFPMHRLLFMCNTKQEADLLCLAAQPAIHLNKNIIVSEDIFRPLSDVAVEFDAIYNARFVPEKRHELAAKIGRVAYLGYTDNTKPQVGDQGRLLASVLARSPRHEVLNPLRDGLPVSITYGEINASLGRAAVGLCLSELEGSNYASMEYMLAGLPVVSTPSIGGRDVFFDPEFCIICEPKADAVRDAVEVLKARNLPRDYVRARTLAKIEPERRRFLAIVDEMIGRLDQKDRAPVGWPFGETGGVLAWDEFENHLLNFERVGGIAAIAQETNINFEILMSDLNSVQLQPMELRPIVRAILSRPRCSLLVFGCGADSVFWEKVNRDGTTVFLEDDPKWLELARAKLARSVVHHVNYGTHHFEWLQLLNSASRLEMELPGAVASRRWDVILVDGPAGYEAHLPGRMQSIYAASKLVAPGGSVFVHDCDRPVERLYAARYLGNNRLFVEARGRSLLNGYAF